MAWKKAEGGQRISIIKQTLGSKWEGIYVKKYEVDSKITQSGKQVIWSFLDEDGKPFEFYGNGSLDHKMNGVPLNSSVRITFTEIYKTKFGKDAANVEVEFDDGGAV